jgi:hypothetical protein
MAMLCLPALVFIYARGRRALRVSAVGYGKPSATSNLSETDENFAAAAYAIAGTFGMLQSSGNFTRYLTTLHTSGTVARASFARHGSRSRHEEEEG